MTTKTSHINCPECNAKINIKDAFFKDIKKDILKDEAIKIREEQFNKFSNQLSDAAKENERLNDQLIDQNQLKTKVLQLEREKKKSKVVLFLKKNKSFKIRSMKKIIKLKKKTFNLINLKRISIKLKRELIKVLSNYKEKQKNL